MGGSDTQLRPTSELGTPGEASYRGSTLKVRVLGPLEVLSNGAGVRLGGPKQRTVLALLAAEVGKPVSVDTLVDGVWGDEPTAGARSTLQTYVSNLRAAIGDVIVRDEGGYRLAADPAEVDAVEFERTVEHAAALVETDPVEAAQRLRAALALWRGHPYADVPGCFALELEARRLEELRLRAVETRIEAELALGGHAQLIAELEVLCEEFPTYERFRVQHMLALYRSGRQAEALRGYQKARAYLAEELGLEPSVQLQELERRILNQDPALELEAEPQVQTLAFLLTDIEGSTVLWELYTNAMRVAIAEHDRIVLGAAEAAGGRLVKRVGDGIDLVFADAGAAVAAASQIQGDLATVLWDEIEPLRVRMAIDVGEVEARGGDYFGPVLNRAGRVLAAAHGGQVLLSADAHAALSATSGGWQAKALGEFRLKGLGSPQHVFQLLLEGLPADFPPLRIDRLPPALGPGAFGRSVRGYELREQVGGSDLGVVYRAYQPTVGREVAIKVIRSELVNQPSFVRGFEFEAQLVAQLEHPHLVPLYDYWRDPEGAYLVMRWLRGGSLRQALDRGPWNLEPASRLLSQVGGALAYAHRQGAVHRSVKPANVLLDGDGNGYLADFGIAARLADSEDAGRPVVSPPAYVSPEELAAEPLTPRSDIYGLGLLTFELLTGQRPPIDGPLPPVRSVRPDLPPALDEVVACAAAPAPDERYESVDRFLAALDAAVGRAAPVAETYTPVENPYKGLRAFGETDAADFYGRDALVGELARALVDRRLVAVVGPSGIGKSSVIKAGLVPSLRRGAVPGSEQWLVTDMFPGSYPYEELAAALLRVAVERPDDLVEELERDELGIRRVMKRILPAETELLLVVDQFEELFTLTAEETRRRFLAGLTMLAADPRSRVRVLVTLRADFLDHPLRYPEFGALLGAGMVPVAAPSEDELAAAIERPARRVGVRYEPGLVSQIIADVRDQPGALPLLQYALTELFAARTSDTLTLEGYVATGGVVGALGRRAEGLYARLRPTAQAACRQVFVRLVSVDPTAQDTRRRVSRRELRQLELDPDAVAEILARYGEHRLLSFDREPLTRTPTVEVAHEAILSQWDRLRGWIDERREGLLVHRRLVEAVAEWQDAGRDPAYLPHENRLVQFEAWAGATDLALTAGERGLLAEARATADTAARRRARRWRATLVGFALLAAAASVLATFALVLRNEERDHARLATARQLAASAEANLDVDPERSILLAIEAAETTRRHDGTVLPEAEQALHDALATSRVLTAVPGVGRRTGIGHVVALAPDASRFVAADLGKTASIRDGKTASIRDAHTGAKLVTLAGHTGEVLAVAYSPNGRLVATGSADGTARLWNAVTGDPVHVLRVHRGGVFATRFSADGTRLATLGADRAVRVWDVRPGRKLQSFPGAHQRTDAGVAWGEGVAFVGRDRIAVSPWARGSAHSPVVAKVFDISSGNLVAVVKDPAGATEIVDLDVSPDGTLLVAGSADNGQLQLYRLPSGRQLDVVDAHGATVLDVEFSRDGRRVATGGVDGLAKIWDVVSHGKLSEALTLRGHTNPVGSVSFNRTGIRLATWGQISGEARVWDVSPAGRGEVLTLPGPKTDWPSFSIAFTPDGRRLVASSGREGEVRVWSVKTGKKLLVLDRDARADAPVRAVSGVDVSPDGSRIATASADGSARIFDAETGEQLWVVRGLHCVRGGLCVVNRAVFSPDGTRIATTGADATVRILDAGTGRQLRVLQAARAGHRPGGLGTIPVAWSPDGARLLSMAPDGTRIWDARSGRKLRVLPPSGGPGRSAVWSPDGRQVLTESGIGPKVWDASSGKRLRTLETDAASGDMAFSRDGSQLANVTIDGPATAYATRIWDWPAGVETLKLREGGYRITFSPDGRLLAGVRQEPVPFVHVWTLDPERLLRIARSRVTRSLTEEECRRYLPRSCSDRR
jgi:WD40 repeat protein/serine/threonine protein kinase/DNA-binding SARP family transcriptional activator